MYVVQCIYSYGIKCLDIDDSTVWPFVIIPGFKKLILASPYNVYRPYPSYHIELVNILTRCYQITKVLSVVLKKLRLIFLGLNLRSWVVL